MSKLKAGHLKYDFQQPDSNNSCKLEILLYLYARFNGLFPLFFKE